MEEEIKDGLNLNIDGVHVLITDFGITEKKEGGKIGIYFVHQIISGVPDDLEIFRDKVETVLKNRINLELNDWLDGKLNYE